VLKELNRKILTDVLKYQPKTWHAVDKIGLAGFGKARFEQLAGLNQNSLAGIYFIKSKDHTTMEAFLGYEIPSKIFYVGRSNALSQRLVGHFKKPDPNAASLVYKMTARYLRLSDEKRKTILEDSRFLPAYRKILKFMRENALVSFHSESHQTAQAVKEIYFSERFKSEFNDWNTH